MYVYYLYNIYPVRTTLEINVLNLIMSHHTTYQAESHPNDPMRFHESIDNPSTGTVWHGPGNYVLDDACETSA